MKSTRLVIVAALLVFAGITCKKDDGGDNNTVTCSSCTAIPFSYHDATNWIFIASAFSPNGDGLNDVLRLYTTTAINVSNFKISIYNSSSALVYESQSTLFAWNGKDQAGVLTPGKYIFRISFKSSTGNELSNCGCVTIPVNGAAGCQKIAGASVYFEDQIIGNGNYSAITAEQLCP